MTTPGVWLTTERLALRRFTTDDLEFLVALQSDPDLMRYVGGPKTRAQIEALLHERMLDYYDRHPGMGIWMTLERATGSPVGFHLLNNIQGETLMQIGYFLIKPAWGRGFGTEMAAALVRYGFVELALTQICGITALENLASQRVLLKAGLRRNGERTFAHPAYAWDGPLAWFERDAADWLSERNTTGSPKS